jgi:hypothetical protein
LRQLIDYRRAGKNHEEIKKKKQEEIRPQEAGNTKDNKKET